MPKIRDSPKAIRARMSSIAFVALGAVYPCELIEKIVDIARRYNVFVLADEIYANIVYSGHPTCSLSEVIGEVPGMALRGISKEYPWPGGRCGWIEVYNKDKNPKTEWKHYPVNFYSF